jgi:hypothetical protein
MGCIALILLDTEQTPNPLIWIQSMTVTDNSAASMLLHLMSQLHMLLQLTTTLGPIISLKMLPRLGGSSNRFVYCVDLLGNSQRA